MKVERSRSRPFTLNRTSHGCWTCALLPCRQRCNEGYVSGRDPGVTREKPPACGCSCRATQIGFSPDFKASSARHRDRRRCRPSRNEYSRAQSLAGCTSVRRGRGWSARVEEPGAPLYPSPACRLLRRVDLEGTTGWWVHACACVAAAPASKAVDFPAHDVLRSAAAHRRGVAAQLGLAGRASRGDPRPATRC